MNTVDDLDTCKTKEMPRTIYFCEQTIYSFFFAFATWTMGSNVITFFHLPAFSLHIWLAMTAAITLLFHWKVLHNSIFLKKDIPITSHAEINTIAIHANKIQFLMLAVFFTLSTAGTIASYKTNSIWPIFITGLLILLASFLLQRSSEKNENQKPSKESTWPQARVNQWPSLTFLALSLIILYLLGHQADGDDANFINLGIGAFRSEAGVFALDTMLGDGPTPLHLPSYLLHSYELLFATLANLLPGSTLFYAHMVMPLIFIVIFAATLHIIYWHLLRDYWLVGAVLHIAFLCLCIDGYPSLGAHGIFRFTQGKAAFINIIVPLLVHFGVRWMRDPQARTWSILCLLQISATGLTANAVYAAPLTLGLAIFPFVLQQIKHIKAYQYAMLATATSCYPLFMGALLLISGKAYPSEEMVPLLQSPTLFAYFGWNIFGLACVAALPLLHFFTVPYRHYTRAYSIGVVLFILNPLLWPLYSFVTGNLGGRIYWSIPFAIVFACALTSILRALTFKLINNAIKRLHVAITAALIIKAIALVTTLNTTNTVNIKWSAPTLKVHLDNYQTALLAIEHNPENCTILAPSEIALNIPMIDNHPYPVAVSALYQTHYRHTMDDKERMARSMLLNSVSGEAKKIRPANIRQSVETFDIGSIIIAKQSANASVYESVLTELRYQTLDLANDYRGFFRVTPCHKNNISNGRRAK